MAPYLIKPISKMHEYVNLVQWILAYTVRRYRCHCGSAGAPYVAYGVRVMLQYPSVCAETAVNETKRDRSGRNRRSRVMAKVSKLSSKTVAQMLVFKFSAWIILRLELLSPINQNEVTVRLFSVVCYYGPWAYRGTVKVKGLSVSSDCLESTWNR